MTQPQLTQEKPMGMHRNPRQFNNKSALQKRLEKAAKK